MHDNKGSWINGEMECVAKVSTTSCDCHFFVSTLVSTWSGLEDGVGMPLGIRRHPPLWQCRAVSDAGVSDHCDFRADEGGFKEVRTGRQHRLRVTSRCPPTGALPSTAAPPAAATRSRRARSRPQTPGCTSRCRMEQCR